MWKFITMILFVSLAQAEVWEKPLYVPDENHLPTPEVQEQEERKEKQEMKKKEKEEKTQIYKEVPKKVTPKDP